MMTHSLYLFHTHIYTLEQWAEWLSPIVSKYQLVGNSRPNPPRLAYRADLDQNPHRNTLGQVIKFTDTTIPLDTLKPQLAHYHPDAMQNSSWQIMERLSTLSITKLGTQWMGIINATPDSFSDGGLHVDTQNCEKTLQEMYAAGVSIIDIGGQSTRPGAEILDAETEWSRVAPTLEQAQQLIANSPFSIKISIDTYLPEIARRALVAGADIINDVSGLDSDAMRAVARAHPETPWIAMHHLGLPADKSVTLPNSLSDTALVETINQWAKSLTEKLAAADIQNPIILDPGIGFGKTPEQNLALLRNIHLLDSRYHWLIGHSRKSYLNPILQLGKANLEDGKLPIALRDAGTIATSIGLVQQGCESIRVHNVPGHVAAEQAYFASTASMEL